MVRLIVQHFPLSRRVHAAETEQLVSWTTPLSKSKSMRPGEVAFAGPRWDGLQRQLNRSMAAAAAGAPAAARAATASSLRSNRPCASWPSSSRRSPFALSLPQQSLPRLQQSLLQQQLLLQHEIADRDFLLDALADHAAAGDGFAARARTL